MLVSLLDPQHAAKTSLQIIRAPEAFRELEDDWNDLTQDSPWRAPFYSWTWYDVWWRHFGAGHELFVIVGRDRDGRLQMVAPLMKGKRSLRGLRATEIGFLANSISPANAILVRHGFDGPEALSAVVACLSEHRRQWDMLKLWNLPEEVAYLPQAGAVADRHGLRMLCAPGWQGAYISWHADFEQYLAERVGKKRLRGIRQKVRQLAERPGYRLLEFSRPDTIQEGLKLAFAVSKASWKGPLGTDMSGSPECRAFFVEITERLVRQGAVRIWVSMLEETPLAVQYQVIAEDATYLIINDFQQAYQAQSPGTVLMYQAVQQSFKGPPREFRFSGDLYDYKSLWATGVHRQVTMQYFHDRLYSRLLGWTKATALPAWRRLKRLAGVQKPAGA